MRRRSIPANKRPKHAFLTTRDIRVPFIDFGAPSEDNEIDAARDRLELFGAYSVESVVTNVRRGISSSHAAPRPIKADAR